MNLLHSTSKALLLSLLLHAGLVAADTIELMNGNSVEGKVLATDDAAKTVTVEAVVGGQVLTRTLPQSQVHALTVNGERTVLTPKTGPAATPSAGPVTRSPNEVKALIAQTGGSDPAWLAKTALNLPKTLDLSWPEPAPKPWNHDKNMGQFIWDIINPNSNRWQEGVKLMYQLMEMHKADAAKHQRATSSLASMYFRFFQDHARAAYWWQTAGVAPDDNDSIALAECYWRLGSKAMALELLDRSSYLRIGTIKLLGDMMETDRALKMAEDYVSVGGEPHEAYLLAGDACRLANQTAKAMEYYEKVIAEPAEGQRAQRMQRVQARAKENLEALKLFELADVSKVRDGTYQDSSLGYEGQVQVSVTVRDKKIQSVKVTQHKEKQYYSALRDVPEQILAKQGVKGVDATSRATITGEAIINATAKALAKGAK